MSKRTVKIVEVELDKVRHLRFDFNAASEFEGATGKNLMKDNVLTDISAKDLRAFLWACLVHEDEELKLKDVGAMMHAGNLAHITAKVIEVYTDNSPVGEAGTERPLT